jgi:DNA-binding NarL/FixJ family response regulator
MKTGELPPSLRTCCRCGQEFESNSREIICAGCRKPKFTRDLSAREKQIVALISQAKANREIALELHLAEGTVKEYLNRIFRKVEVKSRTQLALWALSGAH